MRSADDDTNVQMHFGFDNHVCWKAVTRARTGTLAAGCPAFMTAVSSGKVRKSHQNHIALLKALLVKEVLLGDLLSQT